MTRRWIDAVLLAAGLGGLLIGWYAVGAAVIAIGLVAPVLTTITTRSAGARLSHLVPAEVMAAYEDVKRASALAGVTDPQELVVAADRYVLEVAALLCGRPPRGGTQQRFVASRVNVLHDLAASTREWHAAWLAACAELDVTTEPQSEHRSSGLLVAGLVVVLLPVFLVWDLARGAGHAVVALVEGTVLRMRTLVRVVATAVVAAAGQWSLVRDRMLVAVRDARTRVTEIRLRLRLLRATR